MGTPFEEINFLTRSENRVCLLDALTEGRYTERELVDREGVSKVTVRRTLDAFSDRGWVEESDGEYTTTRVGEMLAEDYSRLRETTDVACRLGPVVNLLPVERMEFDLRVLADATVSDPENHDALRTIDRWVTLVRDADRLSVFTYRTGRMIAEPIYEELREGSLELEAVLPPSELERIRDDPAVGEVKRKLIEAGATYYVAPEDQDRPYSLGTFDDVAAISGWNEENNPQVHVESRAEPVVEWVRSEYEAVKAEAEPLTADDLRP